MHIVRKIHYTGPPLEDGSTPQTVYVVGVRLVTNNKDLWVPMVTCRTLNDAIALLNVINGGQPPASVTHWVETMAIDTPTKEVKNG